MLFTAQKVKEMATKTDWHKAAIETAKEEFEVFSKQPITVLPFAEFCAFEKTGDRKPYDSIYFPRRGWLNKSAILSMVYDDEPKYINYLHKIIWAICDEASWASPPHFWDANGLEGILTHIDLFASETGQALCEIKYMLGDRLEPWLKDRIDVEVRRRIIEPFKKRTFHWETDEHNWAAVCGGNVGMCFMYAATREEFDLVYTRLDGAMQAFLRSYGNDGGCREGGGYWGYGFGYFVYYAEMVRRYTDGKVDYFKNEKVHQMAKFQERFSLGAKRSANFSDCGPGFGCHYGLTSFLKEEYDDIIVPPRESLSKFDADNCHRWAHPIRDFVWANPNLDFQEKAEKFCYMPDAQWYIKTTKAYSLAAKSGKNDEPHNHNDVGSFIFLSNTDAVCDDPGPGVYNKDYFSEKRYNDIKASSAGHNVPIVNGCYQSPGSNFFGKVLSADEKEFVVDIAGAYDCPELKSLVRTIRPEETKVTITDRIETEGDCPVTERFVTKIAPVIKKDIIEIGCGSITGDFDNAVCTQNGELYLIDIPVKGNEVTFILQ